MLQNGLPDSEIESQHLAARRRDRFAHSVDYLEAAVIHQTEEILRLGLRHAWLRLRHAWLHDRNPRCARGARGAARRRTRRGQRRTRPSRPANTAVYEADICQSLQNELLECEIESQHLAARRPDRLAPSVDYLEAVVIHQTEEILRLGLRHARLGLRQAWLQDRSPRCARGAPGNAAKRRTRLRQRRTRPSCPANTALCRMVRGSTPS